MRLAPCAWAAAAALTGAACVEGLGIRDLIFDVDPNAAGEGGGGAGAGTTSNGGQAGEGDGGGGSGGTAGDGGEGGAPLDCPDGPGPAMVDIGSYCIDATPVSKAHYADFIAAGVPAQSVTNDPPYCSWNTTYLQVAWPPPLEEMGWPMGAVDWCDAQAFCHWAGKRLCGAIAGGGRLPAADFDDATLSEYHHVCTQGGTTTYPYGSVGDPGACNTSDGAGGAAFADVGSFPTCTGATPPFDQVFDMSGCIHTWTNECDGETGAGDVCHERTGSAFHPISESHCAEGSASQRDSVTGDVGFRCCADSPP